LGQRADNLKIKTWRVSCLCS